MNIPLRKSWTQAQFFSWGEAQEERHEFDGIQPVAVTGGHSVSRHVDAARRIPAVGWSAGWLGMAHGALEG